MIRRMVCPNCDGKGHVLVGVSLLAGPIAWFLALFEFHDHDGLTRGPCPSCEGEGFIRYEDGTFEDNT